MSENNNSKNNNNDNNGRNDYKNRDLILDGVVNESSIRKLVEDILEINKHDRKEKQKNQEYTAKPINIIVNTAGGNLYDANLAVGIIETSETPVHTYCHSKAMSGGFLIYSAGHKRFATPLATFMYHDGAIGLHDKIENLKVDLDWYAQLRDQMDEYLLSVTNLPKHIMDMKKRLKEDWYLTAQEAFGYGLVDEIIPFRKYNK